MVKKLKKNSKNIHNIKKNVEFEKKIEIQRMFQNLIMSKKHLPLVNGM
jgi:hypothetical protein